MSKRVRLVLVDIQASVVLDDGDTLTPAQMAPIQVPANEWPEVVDALQAKLDDLQARLDAEDSEPVPLTPADE
jgi:hypothetical protein